MPSHIQTPTFQAKISNIQNAYDSSFVYSAGVYTLKNSSGTTTFTVSDAGAVTVGTSAGNIKTYTALGGHYTGGTGIKTFAMAAGGAASVLAFDSSGSLLITSNSAANIQAGTFGSSLGECSSAGAWTLGPASGLTVAHLVRASSPTSNIVFKIQNTSNSDCFMQLYGSSGSVSYGSANGQVYFEGISGKTSSGGTAVYVNSSNLLGTSTSVREAKTNIQPLGSTIGWLKQLKPYVYQYRKQIDGKYTDEAEDFVNTGLIYDEVVQVNPQLCFDTEDGKPSGVEYTRLITPLLKAFQEQQALIEQANLAIEALQAKVTALEALCSASTQP